MSSKTVRDAYRNAASNLGLEAEARELLGETTGQNEEEESRGELIASQEWSGAYAGTVELYLQEGEYVAYLEDGPHTYPDLQSALQGSGVLRKTDATSSIWYEQDHIAPALADEHGA